MRRVPEAAGAAGGAAEAPDGHDQLDEEDQILRSRVDLSALPPFSRAVTERIIRATADLSFVTDLVCFEPSLEAGVAALAGGAPVVADTAMAAAGITGPTVICKADESLTRRLARTTGISAAAAAVRLAFGAAGPGAIWVVGSEPGAIGEILARGTEPALAIAMPAGFTAAVEAKRALRMSGIPSLTNISARGGAVVAVSACMALLGRLPAPRASEPAGYGYRPW